LPTRRCVAVIALDFMPFSALRVDSRVLAAPSELRQLLKETFHLFSARGARFLGAAVAFYALMSAAPFFVIVLGLVGFVFGVGRAEDALWGGLSHWVAPEGIATARSVTERLFVMSRAGSLFNLVIVLYASTRLFRALRRAVNHLLGVDLELIEGARARAHRYAVRYGQAFLLTVAVAAMVAVLVAVKSAYALLVAMGAVAPPMLLSIFDVVASVGLTFGLFLLLLRVLPEVKLRWGEAALGAFFGTCLFAVGSGIVTAYLRHKHVADLYGGASAVVLAVLWVYYSVQVFFLGVCFSAAVREVRDVERRA
jgi:membrane protein